MAFLKEFKEFAIKGNVMDMAVGVIIGGAFGKIVSSLVNDILMPPIGALLGNTDFTQLKVVIKRAAEEGGEAITWNYGNFIQQCVDFTILAFCIFVMVKMMNRIIKKKRQLLHRFRPLERGAAARRNPRPAERTTEKVKHPNSEYCI